MFLQQYVCRNLLNWTTDGMRDVSADDHTAAGATADDVLTLPADYVGIRCSRTECKYQVGAHN